MRLRSQGVDTMHSPDMDVGIIREKDFLDMSVSLSALAELVAGRLSGDGSLRIHGAATVRDVGAGQITLVDDAGYLESLEQSPATAAVVGEGLTPTHVSHITVSDPRAAFAKIVEAFLPQRRGPAPGVSPQAHVDPSAQIADGVVISPHCYVGEGVQIGSGTILYPNVTVMDGSVLGAGCRLFPSVVLYENTRLGDRVTVHANATLGAHGFGYEVQDGRHLLSAQLGNVVVEDDVEIGANATIDRGTYGATRIGTGTKIDNLVMIGHNCRIGRHNLLCAHVGIAGSCTTGDYVVMAGQVGLRDHVEIADHVMIGAKSGVSEPLTEPGKYLGAPAVPLRQEIQCLMARQKLPELRKQLRRLERGIEQLTAAEEYRIGSSGHENRTDAA